MRKKKRKFDEEYQTLHDLKSVNNQYKIEMESPPTTRKKQNTSKYHSRESSTSSKTQRKENTKDITTTNPSLTQENPKSSKRSTSRLTAKESENSKLSQRVNTIPKNHTFLKEERRKPCKILAGSKEKMMKEYSKVREERSSVTAEATGRRTLKTRKTIAENRVTGGTESSGLSSSLLFEKFDQTDKTTSSHSKLTSSSIVSLKSPNFYSLSQLSNLTSSTHAKSVKSIKSLCSHRSNRSSHSNKPHVHRYNANVNAQQNKQFIISNTIQTVHGISKPQRFDKFERFEKELKERKEKTEGKYFVHTLIKEHISSPSSPPGSIYPVYENQFRNNRLNQKSYTPINTQNTNRNSIANQALNEQSPSKSDLHGNANHTNNKIGTIPENHNTTEEDEVNILTANDDLEKSIKENASEVKLPEEFKNENKFTDEGEGENYDDYASVPSELGSKPKEINQQLEAPFDMYKCTSAPEQTSPIPTESKTLIFVFLLYR